MAQPATRSQLIDYAKRQLGAPVLEINVADEQVEDILDDSIQYFQERHFDGVLQTYLKYQFTQEDVDRGKGPTQANVSGITTTTTSSTINGVAVEFDWKENSNYLQVPPSVIGVYKVFRFDGSNTVSNNMFSIKYQLFLILHFVQDLFLYQYHFVLLHILNKFLKHHQNVVHESTEEHHQLYHLLAHRQH